MPFLALALAILPAREASALVVTEIMYHTDRQLGDGSEDNRYEFIELYNDRRDPVDLSGYSFSDGIAFTFAPNTFIGGYDYVVVCADPGRIQATYGISNTAGPWDPTTALDNSGERITLTKPGGAEEFRITYNDRGKWPAGADGTGHSLVIRDPYNEIDDPDHWRLSRDIGGSPGRVDPEPPAVPVVINEALIATTGQRFIELYNLGESVVDLGGYHITNSRQDLTRTTLAPSVTIAGRGWLAFTAAELGLDLSLPPGGDRVFTALVAPGGERVIDAYIFRPSVVEHSEARLPDGDEDVEDAATPTPGAANELPPAGEVVINEIMYHPITGDAEDEYVEILNRGSSPVDLTGWRFNKGIDYVFVDGTILGSGEYLVVARNPGRVRAIYGLPESKVIGPTTPEALEDFGRLADRGERITLKDGLGNTVDTVRYWDGGEWPHWADGRGSSLELVDPWQDNNIPQSWDASDDSAKAETKTFFYSGVYGGGESELQFALLGRGITILDDIKMTAGAGSIIEDEVLVERGESWRFFRGVEEPSQPPTAWRQPGFVDDSWELGPTGIGYGDGDDATELLDMQGSYRTVFCRKQFTVTDPGAIENLILSVIVDDGFYAFLNGEQVAAFNVQSTAFDADAPQAGEPQEVTLDLTDRKSTLVAGLNVLAIQVHNAGLGSSDLSFNPRLVTGEFVPGAGPNLLPNGDFDSDSRGWMLQGNHIRSGRTTVDPISGAGSLKLVSTGRGDNKVNRIETPEWGAGNLPLSAGSSYTISFRARWVVGARAVVTRGFNHAYPASHALAVPRDLGTPGAINSVTEQRIARTGSENLGPVFTNFEQDPALPRSGESVRVAVRVEDADGVEAVKLFYGTDYPPGFEPGQGGEPRPVGIFDDHRDVGNPPAAGSTTLAPGAGINGTDRYTVTGTGADIWQGGDQFQYAYNWVEGDFTLTAHLLSTADWSPASEWGKGGLMARQTLDFDAKYVFLHETSARQTQLAARQNHLDAGSSTDFASDCGTPGPSWLRLTRSGNTFRGFTSANSTNGMNGSWTQCGPTYDWSGAPSCLLLGLAVTSHAGATPATLAFDNVLFDGVICEDPDTGGGGQEGEVALTDPDGDGIYRGTVPGFPDGTKVVFLIEGTDTLGQVGRWPVDTLSRVHPLVTDPDSATVIDERFGLYRHGTPLTGSTGPHSYRVWMHRANEDYLNTRLVQSNDLVEGSFLFRDEQIYHDSGVRFSGSPWARQGWGGSFRVKLPRDQPLQGTIRKFNMEDHQGAGGLDARERTSHYLIRYNQGMISVPYSDQWFVKWQINDRVQNSDREHVAPPNREFLDLWYPDDDDGDLFEVDDRFEFNDNGGRQSSQDARLLYPPWSGSGADRENYRYYFGLRQNEDGDDYSNLIELARVMTPSVTPDAEFDTRIWEIMDVEELLRIWAIRLNSDDWDSWGANRGKNCYLYRGRLSGLWTMFAWDMELTYDTNQLDRFLIPTSPSLPYQINMFPEVERLMNRPRIKRMYYGILKDMVDNHFRSAHLSRYMTRLDAVGARNTQVGKSGGFVDQRRSRLVSRIGSVVSPSVALVIAGSDPRVVNAATVTLTGSAPVNASFLEPVVNGVPALESEVVFSSTSLTAWTIRDIPLSPGENEIDVLGFNSLGDLIDSDTVTVTSTFDRDPPVLDAVAPESAEPGDLVVLTGQNLFAGLRVFIGGMQIPPANVSLVVAGTPGEIELVLPADLASGVTDVTVVNQPENKVSNPLAFEVLAPAPRFIRGDANLNAIVEIGDAIHILGHLFLNPANTSCEEALDVDDNTELDQTDAILLLEYLFLKGPRPVAPFPACGRDDDADLLDCLQGLPGC